jgi:hypothetical protein
MNVQIKCLNCGKVFWVRGSTPRPNEYTIHDNVDPEKEGLCAHLIEDLMGNSELLDFEYDCE